MNVADALPPIRQDLSLHPGPAQADGSPSWTLHDPAANRFYQLGWPAFEVLSRWFLGSAAAVAQAINKETTLRLEEQDVNAVTQFLAQQNLLLAALPEHTIRLTRIARASKLGHLNWLLKHYLFFRVPLIHPMPLLRRLAPAFRLVFTTQFWWSILLIAVAGLFLVSRRWDEFTHTFASYSGMSAAIGIGLSLSFAKILHEMGHALTAHHFGCRVPTMGVAFLVMFPVLYTDTNEAWKLPVRRHRLLIGAAGMLAELTLAAIATLVWNFLPDGPLRAGVFMLATTTWIATLAINASPFMRFDGYFLLSDWLNLPNLHSRAFAFGRCWLRHALLGLDDTLPEALPPQRQRFLVLFALVTWMYRLVLFLGIAFLVYRYFFKALGILLLLVELGWFIALPIWSELSVWWKRRAELRWCWQTRFSAGLLLAGLLFVAVPWQTEIVAPAVLGAKEAQGVYAPFAAEVVEINVKNGDWVQAGQLLLKLRSEELENELLLAKKKAESLSWRIEQQPFHKELLAEGPALKKEWQAAQEAVNGIQRQIAQLEFHAPFAGRIVDTSEALQLGTIIPAGEKLMLITDPAGVKADAFVDESDQARLTEAGEAVFISNRLEQASVHCKISDIDRLTVTTLDQLALGSTFGGPIPTQMRDHALLPINAIFRVHLNQCNNASAPTSEWIGTARLQASRSSWLARGWRLIVGNFMREANL